MRISCSKGSRMCGTSDLRDALSHRRGDHNGSVQRRREPRGDIRHPRTEEEGRGREIHEGVAPRHDAAQDKDRAEEGTAQGADQTQVEAAQTNVTDSTWGILYG